MKTDRVGGVLLIDLDRRAEDQPRKTNTNRSYACHWPLALATKREPLHALASFDIRAELRVA